MAILSGRPLFVPLRRYYFNRYARGEKTSELRPYGPRWNERTCWTGRRVTLSCGYGTARRLQATIRRFEVADYWALTLGEQQAYSAIYGPIALPKVAIIHLTLESVPDRAG